MPVNGREVFVGALLVLAALASTRPVAAEAQGTPTVVVAHLTDIVSPATAQYVHRVVSAANDQGAVLLVLMIDTPGGLDTSMRQMVQDLLNSSVPSVAYVAPSGARARLGFRTPGQGE